MTRFAIGVALSALAACGGGDDAPGTTTTFTVTPASLSFTAVQNGPLPAPQSVQVHRNDPRLVYGSGWEWPSWATETSFANIDSSAVDFDHVFAITTTAVQPGIYAATYDMRTSEPSATWPPPLVELKTLRITYTVTAP